MSLPYRWVPEGTFKSLRIDRLEPGQIIAYDHAVYRVVQIDPRPDDTDYPWRMIMRPIEITGDDPRDRDHDRAIKVMDQWRCYVFADEHYPVCAKCHEPLPCREKMVAKVTAAETETFEQYSIGGVCPACAEPVTARQKTFTWQENIVVPFGPPVTFHLRMACLHGAIQYERRWHEEEPTTRLRKLSCDGTLTVHYTGGRECSLETCPSEHAQHSNWTRHFPPYSDCSCVAGAQPRTAPAAPPGTPLEVRQYFEDQS